ncbi:MAG: helix-turn-helix transcriptional regulator [Candidatus Pelethousia sp.]|nr:helix-turn-helix transcriptional regulator [Candidatus Pelethousia sp.]
MSVDYYDIGKRIRKVRIEQGVTQEQLAERVGAGTTHISHIETGNTIPSLKTFLAIANALKVSPDELLCGNASASLYVFQNEIAQITADCTISEIRIITETIAALKTALRKAYKEKEQ